MKILLDCLIKSEAGPVFTIGMARGFLQNGADIYAILSANVENREQWEEMLGASKIVFIHKLPKKRSLIKTSYSFLRDCVRIWKQFHKISFDYSIRTFIHPCDLFIRHFYKAKTVLNVCHDPIPHSSMDKKQAKKYIKQLGHADGLIVLTKQFIPIVQKRYLGLPVYTMRHGLNILNNKEKNFNSHRISYLFFGRIDGYKGLHVLAKAYKKIQNEFNDVSLTIAGAGDFSEYKEEYERLNGVRIINRYLSTTEIEELFTLDKTVAVTPYIDATQSGIIALAYEYGVPVISSDTGGLREQLCDGKYGKLFPVGDYNALYLEMREFIEDNNLYNAECKKMRLGAAEFDWSVVTQELLQQLRSN